MLWEIVDNAVDEAMAGFAKHIDITLHEDGSASVYDDGRGLPVDMHPTLHVSGVEVIYTKLHAGGKFNSDNYSYSGGLHGVGASVVNALSSWLMVDVYRDFKHYQMRFESKYDPELKKIVSGRPVAPLKAAGNTTKRGTLVRFMPDDRVFETSVFNGEAVSRRLRELAYLNKGVTITFTDERASAPAQAVVDAADELDESDDDLPQAEAAPQETHAGKQVFCFEGGIVDYVKYLNADKTPGV